MYPLPSTLAGHWCSQARRQAGTLGYEAYPIYGLARVLLFVWLLRLGQRTRPAVVR